MRKTGLCIGTVALLLWHAQAGPVQAQAAPAAPATERFDGKWQTTVTCEPARGALGFSYRFDSMVKAGHLRGLRGTEGQPSSLLVEGDIDADGNAALYAQGKTGSKEFVPGRDTQPGTRRERARGLRGECAALNLRSGELASAGEMICDEAVYERDELLAGFG
jgi:hypothetical protein